MVSETRQIRLQNRLWHAAIGVLSETGAEQVNISDLAKAAGVARGTVYNNLDTPTLRYDRLSAQMTNHSEAALADALSHVDGAANQISVLIRLMLRRADRDPVWAAFIARFVLMDPNLQKFWSGIPARILMEGRQAGTFFYDGIALDSVTSQMGGAVLMGIIYVHHGRMKWDAVGADTVRLVLRSVGLSEADATQATKCPLPDITDVNYSQPWVERA